MKAQQQRAAILYMENQGQCIAILLISSISILYIPLSQFAVRAKERISKAIEKYNSGERVRRRNSKVKAVFSSYSLFSLQLLFLLILVITFALQN